MLTVGRRSGALMLSLLAAAALVACDSGSDAGPNPTANPTNSVTLTPTEKAAAPSLSDTSWQVDPASLDVDVPDDVTVTADFASGKVTGFGGCNTYRASYTRAESGELAFGPVASTKKACDSAADSTERAFVSALDATASYRYDGELLVLDDRDGKTVLVFAPSTQ